jgi:hypothetical protein
MGAGRVREVINDVFAAWSVAPGCIIKPFQGGNSNKIVTYVK